MIGPGPCTNPKLQGDYDNDAQGEAKTPKIKCCGGRGFSNDIEAVFEAEVIPPEDPICQMAGCAILVPGMSPYWMEDKGNNLYYTEIDVSGFLDRTYIVEVVAVAYDYNTMNWVFSDYWPRVRVHLP